MRPCVAPQPQDQDVKIVQASVERRLEILGTSLQGLSRGEVDRRRLVYGPNEPIRPAASHRLRGFASQFTHTLALLLWFAAGLAFASGIAELGGAIVAVVLINGVFAYVQEYRAEQVVASLTRRVATRARVVRDGTLGSMTAAGLVPGDIVHLAAGDVVPADCIALDADDLALDVSMLTGESRPVARSAEPVLFPGGRFQPADVTNLLPAGAAVVSGGATAAVWKTGPTSTIGTIAGLVADVRRQPSVLERQVAALSRTTAGIAVCAGAATLGLAAALTETTFVSGSRSPQVSSSRLCPRDSYRH